jgi:hypothetical protein
VDDLFRNGARFPAPVPASSSARLERWYRRLVACYPRSFRRHDSEDIIAVLLATARADQQRPGLAGTAGLLRGALRMRLRLLLPRSPRSVTNAIRLMCLGAVIQLATLITVMVTEASIRSAVRSAVLRQGPAEVANALAVLNFRLFADVALMPFLIAAWLGLAWANARGYDWSRPVALIALLFCTGSLAFALAQGSARYAPAATITSGLLWAVGVAAVVLLVLRPSWPHYAQAES